MGSNVDRWWIKQKGEKPFQATYKKNTILKNNRGSHIALSLHLWKEQIDWNTLKLYASCCSLQKDNNMKYVAHGLIVSLCR